MRVCEASKGQNILEQYIPSFIHLCSTFFMILPCLSLNHTIMDVTYIKSIILYQHE